MRQLLFTVVIWGLSCPLVSATEKQDSIYELRTIELATPAALVEPLVSVGEPDKTEPKQAQTNHLYFHTQAAPFLPLDPSSNSDDEYRLLREWDHQLVMERAAKAMAEQQKQNPRHILETGGAFLLSKSEELTAARIRQQEEFRLLNLYYGFRQR
ncbi:hypothetical protein V6x_46370 [Gimesia chilikensis]|uniref:Uncharacterized protein n=1 Tax=Gimesia chilikensis TaxID=2605989 RepID=A0A517WI34_9PLAN|nr:hypothetical protein [Gimesia chilikensis]QDU04906.1 hypothetical protein V6x_46370 [Gimesia chilikensis]